MASCNKYSTLTLFPCYFFPPFLYGCQHTHTDLGQQNDYSSTNKKSAIEETGRQGPVHSEIGWQYVLKAPAFLQVGKLKLWEEPTKEERREGKLSHGWQLV